MSTFTVKTGDLEPALLVECLSDGRPLDLSGALGASVVMTPKGSATPTVNSPATIIDDGSAALRGRVSYAWQAGDTDTAGSYDVEIMVEWSTGREQTFPGSGALALKIEAGLA